MFPRPDDPRHHHVLDLAEDQEGVLSRRQLYALGITRWEIRANVRAGRWRTVGDQAVVTHSGPPALATLRWAAVFQGGPRAHLDGASALIAGGLQRFDEDRIRVSAPRGARVRRTHQFDIRQTRRWDPETVEPTGIPRTRPAVAAVRAALWARTPKQAALVLTMTVQQRLARPEELGEAALAIRRDRRRALLYDVIVELLGGAESLGEQDFAAGCRQRGLPAPTRQAVRRIGAQRYLLDALFEQWGLVVEVGGIHHAWAENVVGDALRQNALALTGKRVLRLPLLGLRTRPDEFFAQIEQGLREGGWTPEIGAGRHPNRGPQATIRMTPRTGSAATPRSAPGCR